jgi:hypothetical protein
MNLCIPGCDVAGWVILRSFHGIKSMSNQPRVAKVLVLLLISMTTGAVVLMALGNHPPSAGAFCLSTYYKLDPVQQASNSRVAQAPGRWESIEIYYSGTRAGNIQQLASISGLPSSDAINCHFVICNGLGGNDGQIEATEKWQNQWSVIPDHTWYGSSRTIRVCVIADGRQIHPSDSQVRRSEALVDALSRKFSVTPSKIFYPTNWR